MTQPTTEEVARMIENVLLDGDPYDQESLLGAVELVCGAEERQRLEYWAIEIRKNRE